MPAVEEFSGGLGRWVCLFPFLYHQALKIIMEIGNLRGEANALWNTSLAQDSLGKRAEAVKLAKDALAI